MRPNILFLFSDQHRGDWMPYDEAVRAAQGVAELHLDMPVIRGMMDRGVSFSLAFSPAPVCVPARACLASGKRYKNCRVYHNNVNYDSALPNFYGKLRDAGCTVCGAGKFDLNKADLDWGDGFHKLLREMGFSKALDSEGKMDTVWAVMRGAPGPYAQVLKDAGWLDAHVEDMSKGLYGKNLFFEDAARIPMLFAGDGIPAGKCVSDPVSLMDYAPSVCAWGGAAALDEFDGESLLPYFEDAGYENPERCVYSEEFETTVDAKFRELPVTPAAKATAVRSYGVMLRQGRYKYIHYTAENGSECELLYDLEADPGESRNVLAEHPELAAKLRAEGAKLNTVENLLRVQKTRARNHKLFVAYDDAVGNAKGEMWTDNPPEGRLAPEM